MDMAEMMLPKYMNFNNIKPHKFYSIQHSELSLPIELFLYKKKQASSFHCLEKLG
jgi:hypothetical protein